MGLMAARVLAQSEAAEAAAFGVHVWNGDIMEVDTAEHLNQRKGRRLGPVKIVGARNGAFSGKVVAGSSGPVKGLRVAMDALKGRDAMIPASAVRVRYGAPWPSALSGWRRRPAGSDVLLDGPLAVFPTDRSGASVVPIWITVSGPSKEEVRLLDEISSRLLACAQGQTRSPQRLCRRSLPPEPLAELELPELPVGPRAGWTCGHGTLRELPRRYSGVRGTHFHRACPYRRRAQKSAWRRSRPAV